MLSPEVCNFNPPPICCSYSKSNYHSISESDGIITDHNFNCKVSLLLPDTVHLPPEMDSFLKDSQFYKITGVTPDRFFDIEFIDSFIKAGEVTALCIGKHLDLDDNIAITPNGYLILSIQKEVFYSLGIEQGPAVAVHADKINPLQIHINLKERSFKPGKKNYERIKKQLSLASYLKMDFLITWEPTDPKVCPSSVASYFHTLGFNVEECFAKKEESREYSLKMPPLSYYPDDSDELFEWFGATLLGIKGINDEDHIESYLSTYRDPEDGNYLGQVIILNWTGFFTAKRIQKLFRSLKNYTKEEFWIGLHVQGFEDSPVSWGLKIHYYHESGDNNYSLLLDHKGNVITEKVFTKPYRIGDYKKGKN